jgi:SdrD B-like domain/Secretion system C-terminal sorting domain
MKHILTFLFVFTLLFVLVLPASAQISGTAFRDFNANGSQQNTVSYTETGLSDIIVTAYNANNTIIASYKTIANGTYTIPASGVVYNGVLGSNTGFVAAATAVRLEFTNQSFGDYSSAANSSTIQFATAPATAINTAFNAPKDYITSANTPMFIPQIWGNSAPDVSVSVNAAGMALALFNETNSGTTPLPTKIATLAQIGTVWGTAYHKQSKTVFAATFFRKYAGYAAGGQSAIYAVKAGLDGNFGTADDVVSTFIKLDDYFGANSTGANAFATKPLGDSLLTSKVAYGDIEISADGKTLYAVNLGDRKIYRIPLNNAATAPTIGTITASILPVPSATTCTGALGIMRPFGLAVKNNDGKLYVSATCEGAARMYVWGYNPATDAWDAAPIIDFSPINANSCCWDAWNTTTGYAPTALAMGLDFDPSGRFLNLTYVSRKVFTQEARNFGNIMRFCNNNGTWTMENNGSVCGVTGSGVGNNQGPGGGEFYDDTSADGPEVSISGAALQIPGRPTFAATQDDILSVYTAGVRYLDNTNGTQTYGYIVRPSYLAYPPPANEFDGKRNNLGDIEYTSEIQPLEIGNRVWNDANGNGIQDAGEAGMANIPIQIFKGTTQVGTTNTTADGTWFFNNTNVTMGGAAGLLPNTAYTIRVAAAALPVGKILTLPNVGGAGQADARDSDAAIASGNAEITYTTGGDGQNDHTLDMGFVANITLAVAQATCTNGAANSDAKIYLTGMGATTPYRYDVSVGSTYTGSANENTGTYAIAPSVVLSGIANPAVSQNYTVRFWFDGNPNYTDKTITLYHTECYTVTLPTTCAVGNLGGTVFRDYNSNGQQESTETFGVAGVTVTVFDNATHIYTTTTDAFGKYTFAQALTYPVRVEFSGLAANYTSAYQGAGSGTAVQRITAATCVANYGVLYRGDYCQNDPKVATPIFMNGDGQLGGWPATQPALTAYNYSTTGSIIPPTTLANGATVGATWGVAFQKQTNKLFTSAFAKRHVGYGPLGTGGIYVSDMATNTTSNFVNLAALGINTGTDTHTGLPASNTVMNADPAIFTQVGKIALGGLDISEDGKYLWTINLKNNRLYRIFINSPAVVPTSADTMGFAIPNPGCVGGEYHPFAVKMYRGKVYIGGVCDASLSQNNNDLKATIYEFNPTTATFSTVLGFPLTYPKGKISGGALANSPWQPWKNTFVYPLLGNDVEYPQPWLTDIEFDGDGSMILGMADRTAHQYGANNFDLTGVGSYSGISAGDILRAYNNNGSFVLENNASAGTITTSGANNNEGPNGGEFYNGDTFGPHFETGEGGLAILPGKGEVLATIMNPLNYATSGVAKFSNTTGAQSGGYQLTNNFGKAGGIGDVEALCSGAPMQIGNYVWNDANANGVQDPSEAGLTGITVQLWKYNGGTPTLIATALTNANGEYYFLDAASADADLTDNLGFVNGGIQAASGTLGANSDYEIRIPNIIGASKQVALGSNNLTATGGSTGSTATNDAHDSDGLLVANDAIYRIPYADLANAGDVNHTYDFGFKPPVGSIGNYVWNDLNNDGINNEPATAGINGVKIYLYKEITGVFTLIDSTTTANNAGNAGYYNFIITESANYYVKFPTTNGTKVLTTQTTTPATDNNSDALPATGGSPIFAIDVNGTGTAKDNTTIDAGYKCATVAVISGAPQVCVVENTVLTASGAGVGGTYLWDDASTNASLTVSPIIATTYTVTVTETNGCTASTSITLEPQPTIIAVSATSRLCLGNNTNLTASAVDAVSYVWNTTQTTPIITVAPIINSVYTVTATYTNGCTATTSVSLEVLSQITVSNVIKTNPTTCVSVNGSIQVIATGSPSVALEYRLGTGAWQSSNTFTGLGAGFYLVAVRYQGGFCTYVNGVASLAAPAPITATITAACSGANTVLTANTAAIDPTYKWNTAALTQNIAITSAGIYTVTVTDAGGCTTTATIEAVMLPCAALIGDHVWNDADKDGIQGGSETPIPNVKVYLYNKNNLTTPIDSTQTNAITGDYQFTILTAGDYAIRFQDLAGWTRTKTTANTNDGSDAIQATGWIASITVALGTNNMALDAGYYTTTLPVKMVYFAADSRECKVKLSWATATELNSKIFEVWRSADGVKYEKIGELAAAGNSNATVFYHFTDEKTIKTAYYKLIQTDFDGKTETFNLAQKVDLADCFELTEGISNLYPNPNATTEVIFRFYTESDPQITNFVLYDIYGRLISRTAVATNTGANTIILDITDLPAGTYAVKVEGDGWYSVAQKLIKL